MKNKNAAKKSIYKKIKATLSQGLVFHKIYIFLYIWIAFCLACFVLLNVLVITGAESFKTDGFAPSYVAVLIFSIMFSLMLIKPYKLRKEIYLYLDDAVPLYAKVKRVGRSLGPWSPTMKARVEFSYKKENYVKSGYLAAFSKYANKTVDILYSPKYDEILFLE